MTDRSESAVGSKKPMAQVHEIQGTPHKQCECPGDKGGEQTNDEEQEERTAAIVRRKIREAPHKQ